MIPRLHLVTDDEVLHREGFLSQAAEVLEVGGGEVALHLRGPRTEGRVLFSLALALLEPARRFGGVLLANDRVDLALALDLRGAHLGQRSIPVEVARDLLGADRWLGLSVHNKPEAKEGEEGGADYLLVGTIYPTPSHTHTEPGGIARILEIRHVSSLPLLAIGGVTPGRIEEILSAGAHGVAVRGGVWDHEDPGAAVEGYLTTMKGRA